MWRGECATPRSRRKDAPDGIPPCRVIAHELIQTVAILATKFTRYGSYIMDVALWLAVCIKALLTSVLASLRPCRYIAGIRCRITGRIAPFVITSTQNFHWRRSCLIVFTLILLFFFCSPTRNYIHRHRKVAWLSVIRTNSSRAGSVLQPQSR